MLPPAKEMSSKYELPRTLSGNLKRLLNLASRTASLLREVAAKRLTNAKRNGDFTVSGSCNECSKSKSSDLKLLFLFLLHLRVEAECQKIVRDPRWFNPFSW